MTEGKTLCWCDLCGTELYEGSFCYRLEGRRVCPDCLVFYAKEFFAASLEQIS